MALATLPLEVPSRDSNLGSKEWGLGFSTRLLPGVEKKNLGTYPLLAAVSLLPLSLVLYSYSVGPGSARCRRGSVGTTAASDSYPTLKSIDR